jgi:hypothetical protein
MKQTADGLCGKLSVSRANSGDKLVDFFGVFKTLEGLALSVQGFHAGAHVHRQRFTTRANLCDPIAHVCRCESTTQDEVSVDAWRKK